MNYRPLALFLGTATISYLVARHRAAALAPAHDDAPSAAPPDQHRNRGFHYHFQPVGERGEDYPAWVRELEGKSGVYLIRERDENGKPRIVYIGESHTDNLYGTLTRHLQKWARWKGFWRGQYGEGHDPGLTYKRGAVEVATRVVSPDEALDLEAKLISKYKPRDNIAGQPPF